MNTFLEKTAQYLIDNYPDNLSELCIVLPNKRAGLFLKQHLSKLINKPIWLPEIIGTEELIEQLSDVEVIDNVEQLFELYTVSIDDPKRRVRLNTELLEGESVTDYRLSRDGKLVIYQAKQKQDKIPTITKMENVIGNPTSTLLSKKETIQKNIIFPNPATDYLSVRLSEIDNAKYVILDIQGRVMLKGDISGGEVTINLKKLSIGTYLIKINDGTQEISKKFIKN